MPNHSIADLEGALTALGELLAARREVFSIVVVGGTALNLLGVVRRATRDVDVLAFVRNRAAGKTPVLERPDPMPPILEEAIATVARDLALPDDWLNTAVAAQWDTGLPPGLAERIHWRWFAGLTVGIVDRRDLIFLKLYAAADDVGPETVHVQDLLALAPTSEELDAAAEWIRGQDPSAGFVSSLSAALAYVRDHAP